MRGRILSGSSSLLSSNKSSEYITNNGSKVFSEALSNMKKSKTKKTTARGRAKASESIPCSGACGHDGANGLGAGGRGAVRAVAFVDTHARGYQRLSRSAHRGRIINIATKMSRQRLRFFHLQFCKECPQIVHKLNPSLEHLMGIIFKASRQDYAKSLLDKNLRSVGMSSGRYKRHFRG